MSTSSKWLSLGMIFAGAMLLITAMAFPLVSKAITEPASPPTPRLMSGLSLVSQATGTAALQEFTQLHGKSFPILTGSRSSYGSGGQVILWVAGTDSTSTARRLLGAMRDKIASGNSPFQPTGTRQEGNRPVYALDGMGQKHFYFTSGKYLIWLAANPEIAEQALQQALTFYR